MAIIVGALRGLHAAHNATDDDGEALELVHRDVSPQNLFVGHDGIVRVFDFGIAKATSRSQVTREGQVKGKLAYMSPEQIRSEGVDRRSDVFAAAVVLWELLTGERLFARDDPGATIHDILMRERKPPSSLSPSVPRRARRHRPARLGICRWRPLRHRGGHGQRAGRCFSASQTGRGRRLGGAHRGARSRLAPCPRPRRGEDPRGSSSKARSRAPTRSWRRV